MRRFACVLALLLPLVAACGNDDVVDPAKDPRLPKGPIEGRYAGQEVWISYGAQEKGDAARRTGRTAKEAREIAERLHAFAVEGAGVGELAREHSNAPGGAAFGFSSFLPRDAEAPDLRDRWMAAVEVGELTPIIEWQRGFWFAKRVSLERGKELQELFERLIRLRVSIRTIVLLYDGAWIADKQFVPKYTIEEATLLAGDLLARARSGESFESLARVYSEDASAENGGLVTLVRPDGTLTTWLHIAEAGVAHKVLRAAFTTPPGTIYPEVIVSPRGVFLLKVDARK